MNYSGLVLSDDYKLLQWLSTWYQINFGFGLEIKSELMKEKKI
uniref:Uncharacterized protein n=1 Tax=Chlorobium phaeobacteroides (strain BS1) TaxID=331678 RepID=B3EN40_CHLPB